MDRSRREFSGTETNFHSTVEALILSIGSRLQRLRQDGAPLETVVALERVLVELSEKSPPLE